MKYCICLWVLIIAFWVNPHTVKFTGFKVLFMAIIFLSVIVKKLFRCVWFYFLFANFIYFLIVQNQLSIINMADRLTQLQDTINTVKYKNLVLNCIKRITWSLMLFFLFAQQAEHFCNSIGILQQFSTPSKFLGFDRSGSQTPQQQQNQEDYAVLFATLISRCAKDIDTLIESLPSEESSTELQVQSLRRLEAENKEAAEKLEEVTFYFYYVWYNYLYYFEHVLIFNPTMAKILRRSHFTI